MKFEKISSNRVKFTFEVTPHEFEHGLDHAFEHAVKDVEIKGFRKGHVPRNIFEQKFGVESLFEDALNHVISHKYQEIFTVDSIVIVGEPKLDLDPTAVKRNETFELSIIAAIKPEVELGEYKGLEVPKKDVTVSDEDINKEIETLLNQNASLEPKESNVLENGDTAIFDFEGFQDGVAFDGGKAENYEMVIGSNQFIPGFEEQMVGMTIGEEKDINVTFPEQYQSESLAGKPAVFKVKLHELKVQKGETLSDEFVKGLNRDGVETVEQLKEDIKKSLTSQKEVSEKDRITGSAVKFACDNAKVEIPEEMIQAEVAQLRQNVENQAKQYQIDFEMFVQLNGLTMEQFNTEMEKQANDRVLTSLVIEAVAIKENLSATEEEINAKYQEIADMYKMPVDAVKKQLTDDVITNEVSFGKAVDFLTANVKEV
ncbi:Trigger factor (TF) [Paracholeplasma brassicae]|uniref:Trigger factor n=1 Tax=Acholeplasma brassicae TaxID=61635 RepID=U4KT23_9MOLU|nr:trigger factor [Paracholeplasma brassicae]CCV65939.1 Trigger factor (TF) [Paracholeplasma brassicae]